MPTEPLYPTLRPADSTPSAAPEPDEPARTAASCKDRRVARSSSPNVRLVQPERLGELYGAGSTIKELAEKFHVGQETLRRWLVADGIPRRPRGCPEGKYRPANGRTVDAHGYVLVRMPHHPFAVNGYVREHRLVVEHLIGRYLDPEEVVHHRNGIKSDNRPENLQLFPSNSEHKRIDMIGNGWAKGDVGNPKRSVRKRRTPDAILLELIVLEQELGREIRRADLHPPNPSYRAVARAFGSWRAGVALAREREIALEDDEPEDRAA